MFPPPQTTQTSKEVMFLLSSHSCPASSIKDDAILFTPRDGSGGADKVVHAVE